MLSHNTPVATIAVKNMSKARQFYEGKLELKIKDEIDDSVTTYESGDCTLFVYQSDEAGKCGATVATWVIDHDIEGVVKELKDRGVEFDHSRGILGSTLKGDLHVLDGAKMAWFKDPDGNTLALVHEDDE